MGVDHGLGGRNSEKSRIRRERKSKQLRSVVKKLQSEDVPHNTKEVRFDEDARVAFVTGMRKRKQERRKYGLTMQILKEKRQRKDALKSRHRILLDNKEEAMKAHSGIPMPDSDDDENDSETGDDDQLHADEGSLYADDATVNMFGGAVNVVVSDHIDLDEDLASSLARHRAVESDEDEDEAEGDEDANDDDDGNASVRSALSTSSARSSHRKHQQKQMSNFERAMKKVNQTFGSKKKKVSHVARGKSAFHRKINKKVESRKLLTKALGTKGRQLKKRKE